LTVDDIYQTVGFFARKYQSGAISGVEFNLTLVAANIKYYKKYLGIPENIVIGSPNPALCWQIGNSVSDRMRQFVKYEQPISQNPITEFFNYPTDYVGFSSMRFPYTYVKNCKTTLIKRRIEMVSDGEMTDRLEASLTPPTLRRPVSTWADTGFVVEPRTVNNILLTYLREARTPVWAFTVVNDEEVYDPANSVQFEYPSICDIDLCMLMLEMWGISVQDEEVVQYAMNKNKTGS